MRRQIIPITPAATSRIARAPRIRSGSGNESASPGFSLSSARAIPFGFSRPGLAVVVVVGGGGVTAALVVVAAVSVGTVSAVVVVAWVVVAACVVAAACVVVLWAATALAIARWMSSFALEYSSTSVGRRSMACR